MALHGGSQDRGTDQIARRAAEQAGASYYAIVHPSGLRVHLTSACTTPAIRRPLRAFLEHVDVAISVHGFGRDGFALWFDPDQRPRHRTVRARDPEGTKPGRCGGSSWEGERATARGGTRRCSTGVCRFHVADGRVRLGFHPDNPVNLPSAQGVQVELPPGLRGIGDFGEDMIPRQDGVVTEVVAALVELASQAARLMSATTESSRQHLVP